MDRYALSAAAIRKYGGSSNNIEMSQPCSLSKLDPNQGAGELEKKLGCARCNDCWNSIRTLSHLRNTILVSCFMMGINALGDEYESRCSLGRSDPDSTRSCTFENCSCPRLFWSRSTCAIFRKRWYFLLGTANLAANVWGASWPVEDGKHYQKAPKKRRHLKKRWQFHCDVCSTWK